MKVDSGEILAMASYPNYDLNDTRNTDALIGMNLLDENGKRVDYVTQENLSTLDTEEMMYLHLDALWKNFCISDTYEPGSVSKPFTVAAVSLGRRAITAKALWKSAEKKSNATTAGETVS